MEVPLDRHRHRPQPQPAHPHHGTTAIPASHRRGGRDQPLRASIPGVARTEAADHLQVVFPISDASRAAWT
jgi:hypothetical protein